MAEKMQALGPDLIEAAAHAKMMTPEEIEETIDYILKEVLSSSAAITEVPLTHGLNIACKRSCWWPPGI